MYNLNIKKYKIFLLIIILCLSTIPNINGDLIFNNENIENKIGNNELVSIANNHILKQQKQDFSIYEINEIKDESNELTLFYIVNLNPTGFIVITNNKKLPPIISYSFTNEFGEINQNNILLKILITDVTTRLKYINKLSLEISKERHNLWQQYTLLSNIFLKNNLITGIGPLLETKWAQNSPYNNFCPMDKSTDMRSVAGCPAVAMAQILNYHRTTQNIQFNDTDDYNHYYPGYPENRYIIDDESESYDFPSFPELNSYLTMLQDHYDNEIPITDEDKAAITFACGVASKQVYASGGSGTWGVNQAYEAYKRFFFNDVELLNEDNQDLFIRLQENILDGLPVHIAVVTEDWKSGHNMVVDGYNDQGYYHINFGWGGPHDNWYYLPEELPYELTIIEGIIVDIIPKNPESDLDSSGVLSWNDIKTSSTVIGSFIIKNIGEPDSSIDWEVSSYPEWGTWTFNPESGEDLKPENGDFTIQVTVTAPNNKSEEFAGYIRIVNKDNIEDYCIIHASMTTPKNHRIDNSILNLIKNCFSKFSILKNLFYY
jgi:hypothetical protein